MGFCGLHYKKVIASQWAFTVLDTEYATATDKIVKFGFAVGVHTEDARIRNLEGTGAAQLTFKEAKEIKRLLEDSGLGICSSGSPIGRIAIDSDFEDG